MSDGSDAIDAAWDFDHPAASEARFRAMLDGAADTDACAQILTQIARALGLQRRFEEAGAVLNDVEAMLSAASGRAAVRWSLERGRVSNSSDNKPAAKARFQSAWDAATLYRIDDLAVDAAHMLAIVSEPSAALSWNHRALAIAESSTDPRARKWRASLNNNIGWTHHATGDFALALTHFNRALEQRIEQGNPKDVHIARWCTARCLRSLDRVDEALTLQRALASEHATAGTDDGFVHEEIGECLLALKRQDEATPHFARAHTLLAADPWLAKREPQRLSRLAFLVASSSASLHHG